MGLRSRFKLLKQWFDRQEGAGEGVQDTKERERDLESCSSVPAQSGPVQSGLGAERLTCL